jgi:hypothetical protein
MSVTTGQAIKFALLPGLLPRIKRLFGNGFSNIAVYMAYIYRNVGLLPANHPYLNPENIGRFGIRYVMAEASSNLVFDKKHLDQLVVFFLLLSVFVILFMQIIVMVIAFTSTYANAGGFGFADVFGAPPPGSPYNPTPVPPATGFAVGTYDIAFILLDYVFGMVGGDGSPLFNSCVAQQISCTLNPSAVQSAPAGPFPSNLHNALHAMLQFYNYGILAVGFIIFLYYVVVLVVETAQSGTPFGRRFNHLWAPLRLIVAVTLLIPVASGISLAQYLTLNIAKMGSNMATNGWVKFNTTTLSGGAAVCAGGNAGTETMLGSSCNLVATPIAPELNRLIEFIYVARTCMIAHKKLYDRDIRVYLVREPFTDDSGNFVVDPEPELFVNNTPADPSLAPTSGYSFIQALDYFDSNNIVIRFGERDEGESIIHQVSDGLGGFIDQAVQLYNEFPDEAGHVYPFCGQIVLPVQDVQQPGALAVQTGYYNIIKRLWNDNSVIVPYAEIETLTGLSNLDGKRPLAGKIPFEDPGGGASISGIVSLFNGWLLEEIRNAVEQQVANGDWVDIYAPYGWGGAAIWYNKIAELNGGLYSAAKSIPKPQLFPSIMEWVYERRLEENETVDGIDRYNPYISGSRSLPWARDDDRYLATTLYSAQSAWAEYYKPPEENMFVSAITRIFGEHGLFDAISNNTVHPLAQLVAMGRVLTEGSIISIFAGGGLSLAGIGSKSGEGRAVVAAAGSFLVSIGLLAISLGFILFYVIPFLPFLYFFFAVGGWVKGVFEAMLGVPLFALAHIRIDGEGLPGQAAMNGYFLLLEILLRPFLIVCGLVASIILLTAQVNILHDIWPLITTNIMGTNETAAPLAGPGGIEFIRSKTTEFFYTIIYTIVVFLLAMASFKMIDAVPNYVLRWANASVQTFGEANKDPAENLVRNVFYGMQAVIDNGSGIMGLLGRNGG